MSDRLDALHQSVDRLASAVDGLDADRLETPAYPTEWTVADTLSHLGSGAVILHRLLDDSLAGRDTPDDAAPSVWDAWNAKSPGEQAADAVVADGLLLERLLALSDHERDGFRLAMGPMSFDFDGFVGLRLNEHALHLWDIEVAFDPSATVAPAPVACIIDNLETTARFTGRPVDTARALTVATTDPDRSFLITLGPDEVVLAPDDAVGVPDLDLPAEALIRLVYGRLDPDHTPPVRRPADLDGLRQVFPGV
jgi:uncharacterized protein (TIGR03083 family)